LVTEATNPEIAGCSKVVNVVLNNFQSLIKVVCTACLPGFTLGSEGTCV
jgi:hypothetical protein